MVSVDNVAGAALAADHLAALGHRRFAVLTMELADGPGGRVGMAEVAAALYATSRERVEGYFAALSRHGIDTAGIPLFETTADPATIHGALAALFAAPEPPTALLCQSDRIAMRALDWLRDRGLAVPGDVSVVGFDGVPEGAVTHPPLTTFAQPIRALGRRSVEVILDPGLGAHQEVLPVELVVRESTAPPKPA